MLGRLCPGHLRSIHFFERVDVVFAVQRNVRLTQSGTETGIESSIPLFVLITETDHNEVALLNMGSCAD